MRTLLIVALYALVAPSAVSARVGETQQQCAARYGKGTASKGGTLYTKSGLRIMALFWKEKASCLILAKIETNALNKPKEMSEAEIEALLEANGGGSKWVKSKALEIMKKSWATEDGKTFAQYNEFEGALVISSAEYLKHTSEERSTREKKALEGF